MIERRRLALGAGVSLVAFGALVALVGFGDFGRTVAAVPPARLAVILATAVGGIVAMGASFYVISRSLDLGLSPVEAVFLYTSVNLAHNLTPFGQAGGEPLGAAVVSRRSERPYEECLATISALDAVNFVPAVLIFVFGGSYLVLYERTVPPELRPLFAAFTLLVAVATAVVLGVRRYPTATRSALQRAAGALNRSVGRLPFVAVFDEAEVERRVGNFSNAIGRIASNRRTVVLSSALSTVAITTQGCLLWLSVHAVGADIPLVLAVFVVPVSLLASALPLPGGSGGVEGVQILVISATTGSIAAPTITAVVLSRGLVYWTPVVLGSLTVAAVGVLE